MRRLWPAAKAKSLLCCIAGGCCCTAILLAGCGGPRHPTKVIRGTITFEGLPPPKAGEVFFAPLRVAEGLPRRSAVGEFDPQGVFTVSSFDPCDGLVPGTYQVTIQCWRETPTLATKLSANYVPPDFIPEVTIEADAAEPVPITIDVPRLQGK